MESVDAEEILKDSSGLGSKAIRLAELSLSGFTIPQFRALRSATTVKLLSKKSTKNAGQLLKDVSTEIRSAIGAQRYAIRSAALSEDGDKHSQAGQFKTVLDVSPDEVEDAIMQVLHDAKRKGQVGVRAPFSIIVQEYIDPTYAGVVFTRNPIEGREMIVEWRQGQGAEVVGGSAVERRSVLRSTKISDEIFAGFQLVCEAAEQIEHKYDFPQDIEWALSGEILYITQTRPLTTISKKRYEGYRLIEKQLDTSDYYYDQKTLGEAFVLPVPLALDILRRLHAPHGAIDRRYKSLGIRFSATDVFRQFGSFVYIDKEKELKQFFPSHTYFGWHTLTPHVGQIKGFFTAHHNIRRFQTMSFVPDTEIRTQLRAHMSAVVEQMGSSATWYSWLHTFDRVYETVFMVNLLAEKAIKMLEVEAGPGMSLVELISQPMYTKEVEPLESAVADVLMTMHGNSIDIADESPFKAGKDLHENVSKSKRWGEVSRSVRSRLLPLIIQSQKYATLREEARWLSVLAMGGLRQSLHESFDARGIDRSLMYFASIDEIESADGDIALLQVRKREYEAAGEYEMPAVISSVVQAIPNEAYGVSPGLATGIVCDLTSGIKPGCILFVDRLVPELSQHFGTIAGIVSREGGILSHLAILAREYSIPVVIHSIASPKLTVGRQVKIDGTAGTIEYLDD